LKVTEKVLDVEILSFRLVGIVPAGGPKGYFAKPNVETFFELSIGSTYST
jgi:hypothetical protein